MKQTRNRFRERVGNCKSKPQGGKSPAKPQPPQLFPPVYPTKMP